MKRTNWKMRVLSLLLAAVMVISMVPGNLRAAAVTIAADDNPAVADASTMDSWKQFFDLENLSTENAGMVWTDKSVFEEVPAGLPGGVTMTANQDDNFLVALSVMASNKTITGYSTIPTDTMLVLDVSGSMNQSNNGCADEMVRAANAAIGDLLTTNKNNRVGVVLYSGNPSNGSSGTDTAQVILPLGRYTTSDSEDRYLNHSTNNNGGVVSLNSNVRIEGTNNRPSSENNDTDKDVLGGTYIQNGIYKAMQQFKAADTVIPADKIQAGTVRMPILVLMSDGAPTAATTRFAQPGESNLGNGTTTNTAMGFLTQLTAAYAKAEIAAHYGRSAMFYTLGLGMNSMEAGDQDVARHVLDPVTYANDSSTDGYDSYWNDYNGLRTGQQMTVVQSRNVTKVATVMSQRYVDQFFSAEKTQDVTLEQALLNAFDAIVDEIILQSRYTPTLVNSGIHDLDGYVSFVDHIGEHMEVTDVKGMVIGETYFSGAKLAKSLKDGFFGTVDDPTELGNELVRSVRERLGISDTATARALLDLAYSYGQLHYTSETDFSNYIGWYSDADGNFVDFWYEGITTAVPANATHINKSYGFLDTLSEEHGTRESDMMYATIRVREEISSGDVTLAWAIPSALIPTVSYEVSLKGETYGAEMDDLTVKGANNPIRLLYEVALKADIHEYNINELVGTDDVHYNSTNNTYTFYTNDWVETPEDDTNTYSYFEASKENERYYYIMDSVVYTDAAGQVPYTGSSKPVGGNGNHYYHEYFIYSEENGTQRTMPEISADALNDAVRMEDGTWVIPKGTEYQHLDLRQREKSENETQSMEYVVYPIIDKDPDAQYHTAAVLGNNGKLVVTPATGIKVTKTLTETVTGANNTFTFTIAGGTGEAKLVRPGANADGSDKIETLTFADGKASFTMAADETVYIIELADDVTYTITEKNHEDYAVESVNGDAVSSAVITAEQYVIKDAAFVNAPKVEGNLFITKEVRHHLGDSYAIPGSVLDQEFTLTVDLGDLAYQEFAVDHSANEDLTKVTTDENGSFTVELKHADTFEVFDIPQGTVVTVEEVLGENSNFAVTYRTRDVSGGDADDDNKVTIGADVNSTVVVMNDYTPKPTTVDLDIAGTKDFQADTGIEASFRFKVQQWSETVGKWIDITDKTAEVEYSTNESGTKTFTIEDVLKDITYSEPGEYAYQVVEVQGDVPGVTYDPSRYTFTVEVTDEGGQLNAVIKDMDGDTITDGAYNITFTNTYHTAPVVIDVQKKIENPSNSTQIRYEGFRFALYEANADWSIKNDTPVSTLYSDGAGEARFAWTVDAEDVGTCYYVLKEEGTGSNGWTFDQTQYQITVVVSVNEENDDVTADVKIEGGTIENGELIFTNTYNPSEAKVDLNEVPTVMKAMTGRELTANDSLTFKIYEDGKRDEAVSTGAVDLTSKTIDPDTGAYKYHVDFDTKLSFTEVGVYNYDVVEVKGDLGGVVYDETVYDLVVEVTDDGAGKLVANYYFEDGTNETVTFKNTYTAAQTSLVLGGEKILEGRSMLAGGFSFTLSENGTVLQTVKNAGDGTYAFEEIVYTEPGTHTYTIAEVNEGKQGITYDATVHTVTVIVEDNGNGNLVARIVNNEDSEPSYDFANKYAPVGDTIVSLSGTKTLVGRDLKAGEFSFALIDSSGKTVQTVQNAADGSFTFNDLIFRATGTYVYTVREIPESELGMRYDNTIYTVTINVTDNLEGGFANSVKISGNGKLSFTNEYTKPAELTLSGIKTMDGEAPADGDFTFTLTDAYDQVVDTVTNTGKTFTFKKLTFVTEGEYVYTVTETKGTDTDVIYDTTRYHVHVTVTLDEEKHEYVLNYSIGVPSQDHDADTYHEIRFENVSREAVPVILHANKILEDRALEEGEFSFNLSKDGEVLQTKTNAADGTVTFDALPFDQAGTYKYTISEVKGNDPYIAYDAEVYDVTIEVTAPDQNGDNANGPYVATVTYEGGKVPTFVNKPNNASMSFSFLKVDEAGAPLAGAQFTLHHIQCEDCEETIADIVSNVTTEDGKVSFSGVPSGHQYVLRETVPPANYKTTVDRYVHDIYGDVYIDGVLTTEDKPVKITNVALDHTELILKGTKIMRDAAGNPISVQSNVFEFILEEKEGEYTDTQHNMATAEEGLAVSEFIFDAITIEKKGTYTYFIREIAGDDPDVIYDGTVYTVVVTVAKDETGEKLEITGITVNGESVAQDGLAAAITFTNQLREPATGELEATKILDGADVKENAFTFLLKNAAGETVQTVTNDKDGLVKFDALPFFAAGTYAYTVTEQAGTHPYMEYDGSVYHVVFTVTAAEDGDGYNVSRSISKDNAQVSEITFTNKVVDRGVAMLELMKVNENQEPLENVEFTLTHKADCCDSQIAPIIAVSRQDGLVILHDIPSGHTYTLSETGTPEGYVKTADRDVRVAFGQVTLDNREFIEGDPITIVNYYKGQASIIGKKNLEGRPIAEGEFTFAMYETDESFAVAEDAEPKQTTKNRADGLFSFDALQYEEAGTYYYVIKEVKGNAPGVTYDSTEYHVTVVVTSDVTTGELVPSITVKKADPAAAVTLRSGNQGDVVESDELLFNNIYQAKTVSAELSGTKKLTGKDLEADMFSFQLLDENGKVLEIVKNKADGSFAFTSKEYTEAGTYKYTVREVDGGDSSIDYDTTVYTVTVAVTDTDAVLSKEITITKGNETVEEILFANTYNPKSVSVRLDGKKHLEGKTLEKDMFSFQLLDESGKVLETVKNNADGSFAFTSIEYTEAGTYKYTVREVDGNAEGVDYDETVYTVTVVVTNLNGTLEAKTTIDNGGELAFANTYTKATPEDIWVPIVVRKLLVNKSEECMTPAGFRFQMEGTTGKQYAVSDVFGFTGYVLKFSEEDVGKTFTYTITEIDTGIEGMDYSDAVYTVRITISQDGETGDLKALITVNGIPMCPAVLIFVNSYEPEVPEEPTEPSEPEDPTEPSEPEEPTEPSEPEEPTEPSEPEEPTEPSEPEEPTEPSEPVEPTEPSEPEDPTEPSEPEEPTEPSEPEDPTEPSEPEKPTEPSKPVDPDTPDTGDNSPIVLWSAMMTSSMLALAAFFVVAMNRKGKYSR